MRSAFDDSVTGAWVKGFPQWVTETVTSDPAKRKASMINWAKEAPQPTMAHPRAEHWIPMLVAVGAAGEDAGALMFEGGCRGMNMNCYRFG